MSIVLPVFNNEDMLQDLYHRLNNVLSNLASTYELIFVDDASSDSSLEILHKMSSEDNNVKVIPLENNIGQQKAVLNGLACARGDVVIVPCLQNIISILRRLAQIKRNRLAQIFPKTSVPILWFLSCAHLCEIIKVLFS
jgi:glycosyltransferase involved in cell wall biosynthesis